MNLLHWKPTGGLKGTNGDTARLATDEQMEKDSTVAHARLREWTARKEQWRKERAEGKVDAPLKPQQNDRPEFVRK